MLAYSGLAADAARLPRLIVAKDSFRKVVSVRPLNKLLSNLL